MREPIINAGTALAVSVATLFVPTVAVTAPVVGGLVFGTLQSKDGVRTNYLLSGILGGGFAGITFLLAAGFFITTPILGQAATTVQGVAFGFLAELHPVAYALIAGGVSWIAFTITSLVVFELDLGGGRPSATGT